MAAAPKRSTSAVAGEARFRSAIRKRLDQAGGRNDNVKAVRWLRVDSPGGAEVAHAKRDHTAWSEAREEIISRTPRRQREGQRSLSWVAMERAGWAVITWRAPPDTIFAAASTITAVDSGVRFRQARHHANVGTRRVTFKPYLPAGKKARPFQFQPGSFRHARNALSNAGRSWTKSTASQTARHRGAGGYRSVRQKHARHHDVRGAGRVSRPRDARRY